MTSRKFTVPLVAAFLVLAAWYWVREWRPPFPQYLGAVSEGYLQEALASIAGSGEPARWQPIPFCLQLSTKNGLSESPGCESFYQAFPQHPMCALQNMGNEEWDPEVVRLDPAAVAEKLGAAMQRRGCHSFMLDIESLKAEDRDLFSTWSASLLSALRQEIPALHSSIAVHGKTDAKGDWHGAEAQDWDALCRGNDELLLMTYDYSYPGSTPPGETAPLEWVEAVIRYGESVCPKEKLRLGLAAYGYKWPKNEVVTEREWKQHPTANSFVETAAMREQKLALAARYGVERFFLWAMGME